MQSTTIKVPKELHDRLARMAKEKKMTMAAVIEESLDIAFKTTFWEQVEATMKPGEGRADAELLSGTLMDGLDPNEDWSFLL
jgi:predicted transcriptional regulator